MNSPHHSEALSAHRNAAARATHAYQIGEIVVKILSDFTPSIAAEIVAKHWSLLSGKKSANPILGQIVDRTANLTLSGQGQACRVIGAAMMEPKESLALACLPQRIPLFRFTDGSKFTGWFRSFDAARSRWSHTKPPLAVETLTVRVEQILALKTWGEHMEVILVPRSFSGSPNREEYK